MYYHFLGGITTETNFDLILSSNDECFQSIILFLVSTQCISSLLKNRINLQRIILTRKQTHSRNFEYVSAAHFVNACFDHRYSTAVLQTEV